MAVPQSNARAFKKSATQVTLLIVVVCICADVKLSIPRRNPLHSAPTLRVPCISPQRERNRISPPLARGARTTAECHPVELPSVETIQEQGRRNKFGSNVNQSRLEADDMLVENILPSGPRGVGEVGSGLVSATRAFFFAGSEDDEDEDDEDEDDEDEDDEDEDDEDADEVIALFF